MTFRAKHMAKDMVQPDLSLAEPPKSFTKNGNGIPTFF